jgi:hypothetical protein
MLTVNLQDGSIFPTSPKFHLGQGIIHTYDADLMKDGVIPVKEFGVIAGILYCDEESIYVGWSYQVYLWKSVYSFENRIEVEYYTDITYSNVNESEELQSTNLINCQRLIDKITKRQIIKCNKYNNEISKVNGLYDLINNILIKDTYYDNLINIEGNKTDDKQV